MQLPADDVSRAFANMLDKESRATSTKREELGLGKYRITLLRLSGGVELNADIQVAMSVCRSGHRLNGGGDEGVWLCRRLEGQHHVGPVPPGAGARGAFPRAWARGGCGGFIGSDDVKKLTATCPNCGMRSMTRTLTDTRSYSGRYSDIARFCYSDFWSVAPFECDVRFIRGTKADVTKLLRQGYSAAWGEKLKFDDQILITAGHFKKRSDIDPQALILWAIKQ